MILFMETERIVEHLLQTLETKHFRAGNTKNDKDV
jgi:hypothetical protein